MAYIKLLILLLFSSVVQAQKLDSIKGPGEVVVMGTVKTLTIDSNVTKVLLRAPLPKLINNFLITEGRFRYRIKLYSNGVYTKERI
jgi:hypothetical protein